MLIDILFGEIELQINTSTIEASLKDKPANLILTLSRNDITFQVNRIKIHIIPFPTIFILRLPRHSLLIFFSKIDKIKVLSLIL